VVVHGTLLADPDWEQLTRLLRHPSSVPDYRAGREHRAFLTSLRELGAPCDLQSFSEGLVQALGCDIHTLHALSAEEQRRAGKLLAEKYSQAAWNLRR
jgi:lipoate-protein ligase A